MKKLHIMVAPIKFEMSMGGIVEIGDIKTQYGFMPSLAIKMKDVITVVM